MAGRQGQAQDRLVLDERADIERAVAEQRLRLIDDDRQPGEFIFLAHEVEVGRVRNSLAQDRPAPVAYQDDLAPQGKTCCRAPPRIGPAREAERQDTRGVGEDGTQALRRSEIEHAFDRASGAGEFEDIDEAARASDSLHASRTAIATLTRPCAGPDSMTRIVLASTSRYRRELLARLQLPFSVAPPEVDEAALAGESPRDTARRLAQAKARAVARCFAEALVIGSDQIAELDGAPIGKPGEFAAALEQLQRMAGRVVVFHTALALLEVPCGDLQIDDVATKVRFRRLPRSSLEAYLRLDTPFDCAGAAKIEGAGIALVESVESTDPTALIGLPLIGLTTMLLRRGVAVPPR